MINGREESGLDKLIRASYHLLGLQTYFTAGPKEVRAWTFKKGMKAPACAGIIHSDFEKEVRLLTLRLSIPTLKKFTEYYNCTEEEICVGDYIPKEETRCPYKIILGDAIFDNSNITDLGKLQSIGGSAYFKYSEITDLGKLQKIGGDAYFDNDYITNLGNIEY